MPASRAEAGIVLEAAAATPASPPADSADIGTHGLACCGVSVIRRRLGWIIGGAVFAVIATGVVLIMVELHGTRTWEGEARFTVTSPVQNGRASLRSIAGTAVGDGHPITQDMSSSSQAVSADVVMGAVVVCHVSQRFTPNTDLDNGPHSELPNCRATP
jgi:hypothetical protein